MRHHLPAIPLVLFATTLAAGPAVAQPASPPKASATTKAARPASAARATSGVLTFDAMDRNADGRLSAEEFRNAAAFVFAGTDHDNDDRVTRAEAERTGPGAVKTYDAVDTMKAGAIDLPAFVDFCMQVFQAADADHDGFVTVAERDAFRASVRAEVEKAVK